MNRTIRKLLIAGCSIFLPSQCGLITTLNNYDPQPNYSAHYLATFLTTAHTEFLKGVEHQRYQNKSCWSLMPYYQLARKGFSSNGIYAVQTDTDLNYTPLGNLTGPLNLLAVLPLNNASGSCPGSYTNTYTDIPCGQVPCALLESIRAQLLNDICTVFGSANATPTPGKTVQGLLSTAIAEGVWPTDNTQQSSSGAQALSGVYQQIGCLLVENKYKRYGVRFNTDIDLLAGFGVVFCGGFATIEQQPVFQDMTLVPLKSSTSPNARYPLQYPYPDTTNPAQVTWTFQGTATTPATTDQWYKALNAISNDVMGQRVAIGDAIGQRLRTCCVTGFEDINIDLYWRRIFVSQRQKQLIPSAEEYSRGFALTKLFSTYCVMPYASIGGSIGTAKERNINELYGLSLGNNGHNALRARGGISLDFYDTVQICGEFGFTTFSKNQRCVALPTNIYQNGIYPFKSQVHYKPGSNLHMALGTFSRHFYNTTSAGLMYVFVHHQNDCITQVPTPMTISSPIEITTNQCSNQAFLPEALACKTGWRAHLINGSIITDLSPAARGLFFIQIPLAGRNLYKSTTYAVSIECGF